MTARVVSVNRGRPQQVQQGRYEVVTGIDKQPQAGSVQIDASGMRDDAVCDAEHHGGPDQAIYVYREEDYGWWDTELGRTLQRGTFGDNLTLSGLPHNPQVGDYIVIGDLKLKLTAPRIPCATLAAHMNDETFAVRFKRAERPGWYCRVVAAGRITAGDAVHYEPAAESSVSMQDLFHLYYRAKPEPGELKAALDAPIAERLRARFEKRLAKAQKKGPADAGPEGSRA